MRADARNLRINRTIHPGDYILRVWRAVKGRTVQTYKHMTELYTSRFCRGNAAAFLAFYAATGQGQIHLDVSTTLPPFTFSFFRSERTHRLDSSLWARSQDSRFLASDGDDGREDRILGKAAIFTRQYRFPPSSTLPSIVLLEGPWLTIPLYSLPAVAMNQPTLHGNHRSYQTLVGFARSLTFNDNGATSGQVSMKLI